MNEYWNNIIQNAIGCAVGSILAIVVSYIIYLKTIRKSNLQNTQLKIDEETNHLKAYALMLANSIEMAKKQSLSIKNFITEIQEGKSEFPLLVFYPLGELKRIIDTVTIENTGLAYMKFFNEVSAKEFTDCIKGVDYLYAEFAQLNDVLKMAGQNHFNRIMRFSDAFDVSIKLINEYYLSYTEDPIAIKLLGVKHDFDKKRTDFGNLEIIYSLFFKPFQSLIFDLMKSESKNHYIQQLLFYISKGIEYYENILLGYGKLRKEMELILSSVNEQVEKLENNSRKILTSTLLN